MLAQNGVSYWSGRLGRFSQTLVTLLWIELGILLILVPWSEYWEINSFLYQYPRMGLVVSNAFLRGAISGLGVMNVLLALQSFRRRIPAVADKA
jgi:hypothetical protein